MGLGVGSAHSDGVGGRECPQWFSIQKGGGGGGGTHNDCTKGGGWGWGVHNGLQWFCIDLRRGRGGEGPMGVPTDNDSASRWGGGGGAQHLSYNDSALSNDQAVWNLSLTKDGMQSRWPQLLRREVNRSKQEYGSVDADFGGPVYLPAAGRRSGKRAMWTVPKSLSALPAV